MILSKNAISTRLSLGLSAFPFLLTGITEEQALQRPMPEKWSIHEQIAHLGAYQPFFLRRMHTILEKDQPSFDRYVADTDPHFHEWAAQFSTGEAVVRMNKFRLELVTFYDQLSDTDLERLSTHPRYGLLTIHDWMEFFLLHEGHHLFNILQLKGALLNT